VYSGGESGESDNEGRGGVGCGDVYNRSVEPVLVPPSDSYLLLESISVGASGSFSYPISHYPLTT